MIKKFEYFKWDDDQNEKVIDLWTLYAQQDGNMSNVVKVLKYELRPERDKNKIIMVENQITKIKYQLVDNNIEIDTAEKKHILLKLFIAGKSTLCKLSSKHKWRFLIKYKEIIFNDVDPYGEEDW